MMKKIILLSTIVFLIVFSIAFTLLTLVQNNMMHPANALQTFLFSAMALAWWFTYAKYLSYRYQLSRLMAHTQQFNKLHNHSTNIVSAIEEQEQRLNTLKDSLEEKIKNLHESSNTVVSMRAALRKSHTHVEDSYKLLAALERFLNLIKVQSFNVSLSSSNDSHQALYTRDLLDKIQNHTTQCLAISKSVKKLNSSAYKAIQTSERQASASLLHKNAANIGQAFVDYMQSNLAINNKIKSMALGVSA